MLTYIWNFIDLFVLRAGGASRQRGATLVEYALIIAIISLAVLVAGYTIGDDIAGLFTKVQTELAADTAPAG